MNPSSVDPGVDRRIDQLMNSLDLYDSNTARFDSSATMHWTHSSLH